MAGTKEALRFTVRRHPAELVTPAGPTPRELKQLSDIDDQNGLRWHIPVVLFYRRGASGTKDPALVIRDAVARALVHYYPLAGRLRELEGRKLVVDCTGEGVLFIEADADVRLEQFSNPLHPPFPCIEELIFDVPGSSGVLDTPLLLFQVTRLACGGLILAVRIMHAMADAQGLLQFLGAVAELARGAALPTVRPMWARELLQASDPPRPPAFAHREYDETPSSVPEPDSNGALSLHSFVFGAQEVAAVRSHLTPELRKRATTFDVLTGCLWKCLTVAVAPEADEVMRMVLIVNLRAGARSGIPAGYYGNSFACPVALSTAGELCANPLSYAVQLVKEAKATVSIEYVRSVADHLVQHGRPALNLVRGFIVSDVTKAGFGDIDLGWGRPVYGGTALGTIPGEAISFFLPVKNAKGEDAILLPMSLPGPAMSKFVQEMNNLLTPAPEPMVISAL